MSWDRLFDLAVSVFSPTADRFYSAVHGPLVAGLPHPSAIEVRTGREPLWVNLGYWREVENVDAANAGRAPLLLEAAQRELARLLARTASLSTTCEVVDCGFGYGDQDILWAEEYAPAKIRGLNVTELQVRIAQERVRKLGLEARVDLQLGSATEMPFRDASADVVFALECAFHFETRHRFFAEAFRVLRPGGRLVLADWLRRTPKRPSPLASIRHKGSRRAFAIPEDNVCSAEAYENALKGIGFADVALTSITDHVFRPFWQAISALSHTHSVQGNPLFPLIWQIPENKRRRSDGGDAERVRAASTCDFDSLVWPRWLGIDDYSLVFARKPNA